MSPILDGSEMLELSRPHDGIPLLAPVVTDMKQAAHALNWCVAEMERRYRLMSKPGRAQSVGFQREDPRGPERGEPHPQPFSLTPEALNLWTACPHRRRGHRRTGWI